MIIKKNIHASIHCLINDNVCLTYYGVRFTEYRVIDGVIHAGLCFVLVGLELENHVCVSIFHKVQPCVGIWSDKCTSRFGRRRPFILAGSLMICLAVSICDIDCLL